MLRFASLLVFTIFSFHLHAESGRVKIILQDMETGASTSLCEGTRISPYLIATSSVCAGLVQNYIGNEKSDIQYKISAPSLHSKSQSVIEDSTPMHAIGLGWLSTPHAYDQKCAKFQFPHYKRYQEATTKPSDPDSMIKVRRIDSGCLIATEHKMTGHGLFTEHGELFGVFSGSRDWGGHAIIVPLSGISPLTKKKPILKQSASTQDLSSHKIQIPKSPSSGSLKK